MLAWMIFYIAATIGFGAVVVSRFGSKRADLPSGSQPAASPQTLSSGPVGGTETGGTGEPSGGEGGEAQP